MKILKNRLRLLMLNNEVRNITELSRKTGISRQVLSNLDNKRRLDYETIEKLCDFFSCGVGDLLYLEEQKKKDIDVHI